MRVIPGGGPGPLLTTISHDPGRGLIVVDAVFGLSDTSMVVFSIPGHVVGTYNFTAYSDNTLAAYVPPDFPAKVGDQVGVEIVAKGGNPVGHFTFATV